MLSVCGVEAAENLFEVFYVANLKWLNGIIFIDSVQLYRHQNCYRISFNHRKAAWEQKTNVTQKNSKGRL